MKESDLARKCLGRRREEIGRFGSTVQYVHSGEEEMRVFPLVSFFCTKRETIAFRLFLGRLSWETVVAFLASGQETSSS